MSFTPKIPQLPHTTDGEAISFRHEVNPAIALNALTNIYKKVQYYQSQLRQLTHKIHQVYAEGPVVSGWLASEASLHAAVKYSNLADNGHGEHDAAANDLAGHHSNNSHREKQSQNLGTADVALFRHGDTNDLMNYLSALESAVLENGKSIDKNQAVSPSSTISTIEPLPLTHEVKDSSDHDKPSQYYLCRLTSCGQIQTEQCPSEQVPVLSMAIARYRRLNQLTKQKQTIETKLQATVDILGNIETILTD